jgi:putative ABC transport system permease protein
VRGWVTALRIARREARRAKGRSALVVTLIGLPVLVLSGTAATYDMFQLTPEERVARDIGAADAQLRWDYHGPIRQSGVRGDGVLSTGDTIEAREGPDAEAADIEAVLPPGSTATARYQGQVWLDTVGGTGEFAWHAFDLADPVTDGIARIVTGDAPGAGGVALTDAAAQRLGLTVGEQLDLDHRRFTVTGIVRFPGVPGEDDPYLTPGLRDEVVLFHPDSMPANPWPARWLVDTPTPVTWEQVRDLNRLGILVYSRALALDPPPEDPAARHGPDPRTFQLGVVVAGLAALLVALLAAPAFAVGARRRRRDLALIAAQGGTPAHLRRIVFAESVVLSLAAAAAGLLLGIAGAVAARHWVGPQVFGALPGGYRFYPLALLGTVAFAVAAGTLAAVVPAFTAAAQPVVDALAGRQGVRGFRRRWLVTGLAVVVLGALIAGDGAWRASAPIVLAGLVLTQLGLVLCAPALIGLLAQLGDRLPLAARIALRDTARNRSAAAPAVSAVLASVAAAVTAGVVMSSFQAQNSFEASVPYPPGTVLAGTHDGYDGVPAVDAATVEQMARGTLPVDRVHRLLEPVCAQEPHAPVACMVVVAVPAEHRCPYQPWDPDLPFRTGTVGPLSDAEQRDASRDRRCDHPRYLGMEVVVDDGSALPAMTDATGSELAAAAAVLRDGGAVVTNQRYLSDDGTVTLLLLHHLEAGPTTDQRIAVPGHLLLDATNRHGAILAPAALEAAGLGTAPGPLVMSTTRMPTQVEGDAFTAALQQLGTWGRVERAPVTDTDPVTLLLAAAAAVIALGAAAIATGLSTVDRRADLTTLGAVGASPGIRRGIALSQSGVIAGLGTLLGLGAGLGTSVIVLSGLNQRFAAVWPSPGPIPITVPWSHLFVLLLVPLVAMAGAALLTRSRLAVARRRS